jgi:hypothetical protein
MFKLKNKTIQITARLSTFNNGSNILASESLRPGLPGSLQPGAHRPVRQQAWIQMKMKMMVSSLRIGRRAQPNRAPKATKTRYVSVLHHSTRQILHSKHLALNTGVLRNWIPGVLQKLIRKNPFLGAQQLGGLA